MTPAVRLFSLFRLRPRLWRAPGPEEDPAMKTRSYSHGLSPLPLLGETIGETLRPTAPRHGPREALGVPSPGGRRTPAQREHQARREARVLMSRGVANGDRVRVSSPR